MCTLVSGVFGQRYKSDVFDDDFIVTLSSIFCRLKLKMNYSMDNFSCVEVHVLQHCHFLVSSQISPTPMIICK